MSGTKGAGGGSALDADTKEFLFNMEKTAKNILKEHNKRKLLEAARAKAEAVRKRAWEEANVKVGGALLSPLCPMATL